MLLVRGCGTGATCWCACSTGGSQQERPAASLWTAPLRTAHNSRRLVMDAIAADPQGLLDYAVMRIESRHTPRR